MPKQFYIRNGHKFDAQTGRFIPPDKFRAEYFGIDKAIQVAPPPTAKEKAAEKEKEQKRTSTPAKPEAEPQVQELVSGEPYKFPDSAGVYVAAKEGTNMLLYGPFKSEEEYEAFYGNRDFSRVKTLPQTMKTGALLGRSDIPLSLKTDLKTQQGIDVEQAPKEEKETPADTDAPDTTANLESALEVINQAEARGGLDPVTADIFRNLVKVFPEGVEVNPQEILKTFEQIEQETIDPQFRFYVNQAKQDVRDAVNFIQGSRAREIEAETIAANERIRAKKQNLEARGMTFSGEGVRDLGQQSAFPGITIEGTVPQANRLIASSSAAEFTRKQRKLGAGAEQELGSEFAGSLQLPAFRVIGGFKGRLEQEKQGTKAQVLRQLIGNKALKTQASLDQPPQF